MPKSFRSSSSSSSSFSSLGSTDASSLASTDSYLRFFLIQTAKGLFSSSGGYKANISLLRFLASCGHSVRQICYSHDGEVEAYIRTVTQGSKWDPNYRTRRLHLRSGYGELGTNIKIEEFTMEDGVQVVSLNREAFDKAFGGKGTLLRTIPKETAEYIEEGRLSSRLSDFVSFLQQEITNFSPTHVLFNDGLSMQATSATEMPELNARRIAIIHTAEQLPFGPFSGGMPGHVSTPSESMLLQQVDGIWSVSEAIRRYALEHGQLKTNFFVHHPWTYLDEKTHALPTRHYNWDKKYIGMINPCKVKGVQILASLAEACPQHNFLVYKSWGFDDVIGAQLKKMQNMTCRSPCTDMEEAWRDIKILLVPSLWFEAWGIVVIEAHLRGIPVIASDAGALTEAMLGLDYIVPVSPIQGERDEKGEYIIPRQNVWPWVEAVNRFMSDEAEYRRVSNEVRSVTSRWVVDSDERALEGWLMEMSGKGRRDSLMASQVDLL